MGTHQMGLNNSGLVISYEKFVIGLMILRHMGFNQGYNNTQTIVDHDHVCFFFLILYNFYSFKRDPKVELSSFSTWVFDNVIILVLIFNV